MGTEAVSFSGCARRKRLPSQETSYWRWNESELQLGLKERFGHP
jgi:hypothetical protein